MQDFQRKLSLPGLAESCEGLQDTFTLLQADSLDQEQVLLLRHESHRLHTFRNWPREWAGQLAGNGLYCTREGGDTLRCAFCGLELRGLQSAREGRLQHWQNARGYCPFLKGQDVGNVTEESEEDPVSSRPTQNTTQSRTHPKVEKSRLVGATPAILPYRNGQNVAGNHLVTSSVPHATAMTSSHNSKVHPAEQPGCTSHPQLYGNQPATTVPSAVSASQNSIGPWAEMVRTARYPHMASFDARRHSLRSWPLIRPTVAEVARSGLFQAQPAGFSQCLDSVKCFWCGQRFHRWQTTDDALLEHARLSPNCRYVRQLLGQEVHSDVTNQLTIVPRLQKHHSGHQPLSARQTVTPSAPPYHLQQPVTAPIDEMMASPNVQRVVSKGYAPPAVISVRGNKTNLHHHQSSAGPGEGGFLQPVATIPAAHSDDAALLCRESRHKALCKLCSRAEVKVTFRPCNHLLCCSQCAEFFSHCPVCQRYIEELLTTYLA